jgi:hypothetical protein
MGLWSSFGELWGWLSEEKPAAADVFPPPEVMGRNGGTDNDGAVLNYWASGFEIGEKEDIANDIFGDVPETEEDTDDNGEYDEEL